MKTLYLTRHAKSDWDHPGLPDHERPLNKRGRRDALRMGAFLASHYEAPGQIVSSSAVRARATAEAYAEAFGLSGSALQLEPQLYLASTHTLLEITRLLPAEATTVMLTGHNPGMTEYLDLLTGGNIGNLPTCAVARVGFEVDAWGEVRPGLGQLLSLDVPKALPENA